MKDVAAAEIISKACKRWGKDSQYLYVSRYCTRITYSYLVKFLKTFGMFVQCSGGMYKGSTPEGGFKEAGGEVRVLLRVDEMHLADYPNS
jgi:hypothetical protein